MLIWPSFLPHAVERGSAKTNEDRIVVAFNVMIRGKIENPTAYLEFKIDARHPTRSGLYWRANILISI